MKQKRTCIGLDIGRSAVKIVARYGKGEKAELVFPSAFSPARRITDESEARRSAAETVEVNGKSFFVGETALLQGRDDLIFGLTDDWALSDQHAALFLASFKKLAEMGVPNVDKALVVVGLPARLFAHQKNEYLAHVSELVKHGEAKVVPQSLGPYYSMMFDANGQSESDFDSDESSWGIIEVGQYTTDFALVQRGRPIEHAFDSCEGMQRAATDLQPLIMRKFKIQPSMTESTNLLANPVMKHFGEKRDVGPEVRAAATQLTQTIIDKANQVFGDRTRSMDGIRVAGGGAPLVIEALKEKWPNSSMAENSRFTVADGFCRFALGLELYNASKGE